jgi:hypothetical protein
VGIIGGLEIDPKRVVVEREERQRKEIDVRDLVDSIRDRGVINPITLRNVEWANGVPVSGVLVAGERRLTTCLQLNLHAIPFREAENLSEEDVQLIELEENTKRVDLPWQDKCLAFKRIYDIHKTRDPKMSIESSASHMGVQKSQLTYHLSLAGAIRDGDKAIAEAPDMAKAWTIYTRRKAREQDAALNEILDIAAPALRQPDPVEIKTVTVAQTDAPAVVKLEPPKPKIEAAFKIVHSKVEDFFAGYKGPRFNLIHCDLPYGVALNGQANQDTFEGGGYDSSPDIYWHLCRELAKALPQITGVSAHIMFWISMKFYEETLQFFREHAPQIVWNPTPFIWHKTDNKGVVPDARRMPRNVYEAALIGTIGDRFIVKPVSNAYGAPTNKADSIHTNEKPEAMLKHFLSMFVDEHTVALDPTCGSGSAIRAIEALGGKSGIGVEFNAEFAARAQTKLETTRKLKSLSEKINV